MRLYEQRATDKRDTFCPTCGKTGHMWTTCPAPAKMVELELQGKEPDLDLYSEWARTTYGKRGDDGNLLQQDLIFTRMRTANCRQQDRIAERKARKDQREREFGKPAKRKVSCGFCGELGHNRRHCEVMNNFIDDLSQANQNYRKEFYKHLVKGRGFAVGALVSLSCPPNWYQDQEQFEGIGIISSINWEQVNLGLAILGWDYKTTMNVGIVIDGQTTTYDQCFKGLIHNDISKDDKVGDIAKLFGGMAFGYGMSIEDIIAPSEDIPSEEWFSEGYTECWTWITKNKSLAEITRYLSPLIATWHPSRRGRNAGKLNSRLGEYGMKINK